MLSGFAASLHPLHFAVMSCVEPIQQFVEAGGSDSGGDSGQVEARCEHRIAHGQCQLLRVIRGGGFRRTCHQPDCSAAACKPA
jgi:hypothetical protein